jgi:hypothetical protein
MIFENVTPGVDTFPRVGENWWRPDWLGGHSRPKDFVVSAILSEGFNVTQLNGNNAVGFYPFKVQTDWCYERVVLECAECDAIIPSEDHYLCEACRV